MCELPGSPTGILNNRTSKPVDPNGYRGWWLYVHQAHGFSLLLPTDWTVTGTVTGNPLMSGHHLNLQPKDEASKLDIRLSYRRVGEDVRLWPTGVGQGEFVSLGELQIDCAPVSWTLFVCPTGEIQSIWYQGLEEPQFKRRRFEYGIIFSFKQVCCQEGYSLSGKNQFIGEMIIASLKGP